MKKIRRVLYPFGLIFGLVTLIRNFLYDKQILKSYKIPLPAVNVGNLSVGGTGKSPLVQYLVQLALNNNITVTTLSRGYGRKSKGLLIADEASNASQIGDEPMQYLNRFGKAVNVVVCEDRTEAVKYIERELANTELLILDDALQHRKVKAGMNIVVSSYDDPFYSDFMLPAGNLREPASGIRRADLLVVSKCPELLSPEEMDRIRKKIPLNKEQIFFSRIVYGELKSINDKTFGESDRILLVTGIANPKPLVDHLSKSYRVEHLRFKDHHDFTSGDICGIHEKFNTFAGRYGAVITTEKDFMRIGQSAELKTSETPWFYQPIETEFTDQKLFDAKIIEHVRKV